MKFLDLKFKKSWKYFFHRHKFRSKNSSFRKKSKIRFRLLQLKKKINYYRFPPTLLIAITQECLEKQNTIFGQNTNYLNNSHKYVIG